MPNPSFTPAGFLQDAQEFFAASELVLSKASKISLPAYFLLGRSVELSLKAFLLRTGMPIKELKSHRFGHNLRALLKASMERGLQQEVSIEPIEVSIIELLNYDYMEKRFEYRITDGTYALPRLDITCVIARRLAFKLESFCKVEENSIHRE